MSKVHLDPQLTPYTGGVPVIEVFGSTVATALRELFNQYPQLYVHIFSQPSRIALVLNDDLLLEESDLPLALGVDDRLDLFWFPAGQDATAIGTFIIDMAAEYGAISAATWAAAGTVTATVIGSIVVAGVMLALSYAIGALTDDISMPDLQTGSLDNSATYTFTGIKNTTAAGTPIQVVYGTHRTGGQVITLFTTSEDTNTTTAQTATAVSTDTHLLYQIGLSEGEITEVKDIEINKLPVTFFQAVRTVPDTNYWRAGTADQTPMYEFNKVITTVSTGRKVLNGATPFSLGVTYEKYLPVYGYVQSSWLKNVPILGYYVPAIKEL
jgi:predicted phage tail protein